MYINKNEIIQFLPGFYFGTKWLKINNIIKILCIHLNVLPNEKKVLIQIQRKILYITLEILIFEIYAVFFNLVTHQNSYIYAKMIEYLKILIKYHEKDVEGRHYRCSLIKKKKPYRCSMIK